MSIGIAFCPQVLCRLGKRRYNKQICCTSPSCLAKNHSSDCLWSPAQHGKKGSEQKRKQIPKAEVFSTHHTNTSHLRPVKIGTGVQKGDPLEANQESLAVPVNTLVAKANSCRVCRCQSTIKTRKNKRSKPQEWCPGVVSIFVRLQGSGKAEKKQDWEEQSHSTDPTVFTSQKWDRRATRSRSLIWRTSHY